MTSGKFDINGHPIWYEKFGDGPHPLLLIAGAIGTGRSDFYPQLIGANALDQKKYTIICIELPGWGRSRPPERPYGPKVYENDADCANKLMMNLGYNYYSVLGWSDGAKVALIMPMFYPAKIAKCIVMGILTYVTARDIKAVLATRNTKFWGKEMIDNYTPVYGNDLQKMWDNHMVFCEKIPEIFPEGVCQEQLSNIRCPLLIIHGNQDPLVADEHPFRVLKMVSDARIHQFPKGGHNPHHVFQKEFKTIVENFIDDD